MSSIVSHIARAGVGASSTEAGAGLTKKVELSKPPSPAFPFPRLSKQPLPAIAGQSSLVYAAELVDGREPTGDAPWREPRQWLSPSKQPHHVPAKDPVSFANNSTPTFNLPFCPSFEYLATLLSQPPLDQLPPVSQTSAGVAKDAKGQILKDLRELAQWPRLHDPILPPLVGDIESDPSGIVDQYGVKGGSALTAFFDVDALSCHVCGFKAGTLEDAVIHQEEERHFWS